MNARQRRSKRPVRLSTYVSTTLFFEKSNESIGVMHQQRLSAAVTRIRERLPPGRNFEIHHPNNDLEAE